VEAEARRLAGHGVREITLLGQNVNAYHGRGPDGVPWSLAQLIGRLASIDGLERLRYTTSHPRDMTDDLIAAHGEQRKLMPYLHLPFQAGADRVLAAMNRRHTAADYLALVARKVMPVLFERQGRHPGQLVGRSPYLQAVHAAADSSLLGRVVEVAIESVRPNSLCGAIVARESP